MFLFGATRFRRCDLTWQDAACKFWDEGQRWRQDSRKVVVWGEFRMVGFIWLFCWMFQFSTCSNSCL